RIFQNFICFRNFLESLLRTILFADIGMIFACKLAIRAFDRFGRSVALDAKNFIVVLVFHGYPVPSPRAASRIYHVGYLFSTPIIEAASLPMPCRQAAGKVRHLSTAAAGFPETSAPASAGSRI